MTARDREPNAPQDIRSKLERCSTQFDVFRLLRETTELHGFNYFFIAQIPDMESPAFTDMMIITSAPADLVQQYGESGLIENSPLDEALSGIGGPREHRLDQPTETYRPDQLAGLALFVQEYGFNCWFITPVYHSDHGPAAVCFLGKRPPVSQSEAAELCLVSHLAHHRLRLVSAKPTKADSPLTERERECLVWTSAGKTSVEIARILSLSEHTVNHYLNNAARKLDAVNRTQAVAFAIRQGFIN